MSVHLRVTAYKICMQCTQPNAHTHDCTKANKHKNTTRITTYIHMYNAENYLNKKDSEQKLE